MIAGELFRTNVFFQATVNQGSKIIVLRILTVNLAN